MVLAIQTMYDMGNVFEQHYKIFLLVVHGVELTAEPFELTSHTAVIAGQANEGAVSAKEES